MCRKWTTQHKIAMVVTVICIAASYYFFGDAFDCMFSIGKFSK